jgi:hypothetical protein
MGIVFYTASLRNTVAKLHTATRDLDSRIRCPFAPACSREMFLKCRRENKRHLIARGSHPVTLPPKSERSDRHSGDKGAL